MRLVFGTVDLPDTRLHRDFSTGSTRAGGRALDVANVYRDGESAEAVGRWLRARHSPDGVVVYAKGCHPPYCRPELVSSELDKARRLLGLDRIDVFVLHRDDPSLPVAAFADALLEQVAAGTIGGFGVSNWTVPRLRELQLHLDRVGEDGLVVFSNHFSLAEMVAEPWPGCLAVDKQDLIALADTDLLILAWSSLATGFFAGRDPRELGQPRQPRTARAGDASSPKSSGPQPQQSRSRTSSTSPTTCCRSSARVPRSTSTKRCPPPSSS